MDKFRDLLAQDYKHKHVADARCVTCGRSDLPVALHVIEFYQPESAQLPPFFIAMSASRGTLRGSIPVCSACCSPCGTCALPVVTPWIRRVVRALSAQFNGVRVSVGNGYCRHVHAMADVTSLFRPVRLASRPVTSVHVEPNYLPSYVHLAMLRSMVNQGADAIAFCNKGMEVVARLRRAPLHRSDLPAVKNAGQDLDEIERRLMSIKASLRARLVC